MIESSGVTSGVLPTGRSILAGCLQSVPWVKTFLHDALDFVVKRFPFANVESYIDDISLALQGTFRFVSEKLPTIGKCLWESLTTHGSIVSPKTTGVASSAGLQAALSSEFQRLGVKFTWASVARDLGVYTTAARRRTSLGVQLRRAAANKRWARVKRLMKLSLIHI